MGLIKPVLLLGTISILRKYCTVRRLKRFVPIASWLPNYKLSFVKNDLIAGITVGLTLVPQALAFAQVANLPPEYGLYSSFMGLYVYTLLGTSKDAGLGPTNLLSMLVGQVMLGLNSQNPVYTSLMSLFCGITLLVMGFLQLGFLVNMFSIPVTCGFTSAAGIVIIVNQLGNLFGMVIRGVTPYQQLKYFCINFTRMNFSDLITGGLGLVFLVIMQRMPNFAHRRFPAFNRDSRWAEFLRLLCASRNVILVVVATLFSFLMSRLHPEMTLTRIGQLPSGLPVPTLPSFAITNQTIGGGGNETSGGPVVVVVRTASQVVFEDLGMALVVVPLMTMLELFAITKALGRKNHYRVDHSQELVAVGLANVAGSFFHAFPITAAVTRSALNDQCRVSSPLAGSLSAVVVIIAVLFAMPVFYFIPKAILAAIIMSAGLSLIDLATVAHVWHEWRWDLVPLAATFFTSLFTQMWQGILVGISISLAMLLAPVVRLKIVTEHLTSSPSTPPQMAVEKTPEFFTPGKQINSTGRKSSNEPTPFQTPPSIGAGDQASQNLGGGGGGQIQKIVIVRLQQGLQYPSVDRFTNRMSKILAKEVGQIVIDCQFITGLDFTALQGIRHVLLLAYRLNRSVVFARLSDHLRKHIELLDIDHFRHVSRWDDILAEEGGESESSSDWYGTRASLNGSAFGESNVDAMVAKRSVGKNLEDLTPIPEEQSEQSIEVITIRSPGGSPTGGRARPSAISMNGHVAPVHHQVRIRPDHGQGMDQLSYEPHFFGSAIPLAVGSVSLEDVTQLANKELGVAQGQVGAEALEKILRGSRHMSYVISDVEEGNSDSGSDSDGSDPGIKVANHVAGSAVRRRGINQVHHRPVIEHVELLEFTRKPSNHGHAASGEVHDRSGENSQHRNNPPVSESKQVLIAASSYPHLKLNESETAACADALVSNLARSLSHQNTTANQDDEGGLQMVAFSSSKKLHKQLSENEQQQPSAPSSSSEMIATSASSPTVVIVHSATSDEAQTTTRDKLD